MGNVVQYDLQSSFDLESHKKVFQDYLEVIIDRNGTVMYAVPSHQEKLIQMACEENGWSREQLMDICPKRFHYDFISWLLLLVEAVSVWNNFCMAPAPNEAQIKALKELRDGKVYRGDIPDKPLPGVSKKELLAKEGRTIWEITSTQTNS